MIDFKKSLKLEDLPDLLTVREVAEILRVSPLTIKRWGKRGKLPAIRINSRGGSKISQGSRVMAFGHAKQGLKLLLSPLFR